MILCSGRGKEETKISVSNTSSPPQEKPCQQSGKQPSLCSEKPFTALWERNSTACATHVFINEIAP